MSRRGRDVRRAEFALRSRSSSSSSRSRTPVFLRREDPRGGELVLRSRQVETGYVRRRSSSSSSPERRVSKLPANPTRRERVVLRERSPRVRLERDRSVSPDDKVVILSRHSSPSPDRFRAKITGTARRAFSREPSPEPPQRIRGPTIEREVITHWKDVDHGVIRARSPSPVQGARRPHRNTISKDTDIDIDVSHAHERGRHQTDVDIDIRHSHSPMRRRSRSRSRSRVRRKSVERLPPAHFHDDTEIVVRSDRDRLRLEAESSRRKHRRSHSAIAIRSPSPSHSEEADYITSRINARGETGEAWNGHTRDWTIVDVPPGTERVQLDGVGGAAAEVTWSRYSGVRRSKFIPERDGHAKNWSGDSTTSSGAMVVVPDPPEKEKERKMSVSIYDKDREREVEIETSRRRARTNDRWTEITKDLVSREAIDRMGYEYEETEWFYYIMEYLKYEDVVELVNLSDKIREARRRRARETEWEREFGDHHHHFNITATHKHRRRSRSRSKHW